MLSEGRRNNAGSRLLAVTDNVRNVCTVLNANDSIEDYMSADTAPPAPRCWHFESTSTNY